MDSILKNKLIEVQDLCINDGDIVKILRLLKVINLHLNSDELNNLCDCELNGYADTMNIPPYRDVKCILYASYGHPYGRHVNNYEISKTYLSVDEPNRERIERLYVNLTEIKLKESVHEIQNEYDTCQEQVIRLSIPQREVVLTFYSQAIPNIFDIQRIYTKNNLTRILQSIRNRVLDFIGKMLSLSRLVDDLSLLTVDKVNEDKMNSFIHVAFYGEAGDISLKFGDIKAAIGNNSKIKEENHAVDNKVNINAGRDVQGVAVGRDGVYADVKIHQAVGPESVYEQDAFDRDVADILRALVDHKDEIDERMNKALKATMNSVALDYEHLVDRTAERVASLVQMNYDKYKGECSVSVKDAISHIGSLCSGLGLVMTLLPIL